VRVAIKKSELYSSLWASCDELRGGMDASQYKDYVLVLLFIKYVSDKYAGQPYAPITIPEGASFADMVKLKGKADIGDQINKKIVGPLKDANKLFDVPDFNDDSKLGSGKEKVDRLTNLIGIFENSALDFSKNRADGDDILGDAYEYLMRHFATESGKSKGQFYTPAEVSRVIAQVIGIRRSKPTAQTTVYDPTCGSGSLLLKVADEAGAPVTLYGQEKDSATSGLARMNLILHDFATAEVRQGNTLTDPKFKVDADLKTFDFVVANPPFSDKRWSNGLTPEEDPFKRFDGFGIPPDKQGDYAYLLHIVRSLRSSGPEGTGRGACILPHGVLFRGNAEAEIRKNLLQRGLIEGIIGLPPNLFYGTGIPACIVVLNKRDAKPKQGLFLVDASAGFAKDGPKNRLRAQDIHKIVDVFTRRLTVPRYSRFVPWEEIEKNDFNLNLPRYVDSQLPEDIQDLPGHLQGGIPQADVDVLARYWEVCPGLRDALFAPLRAGYVSLATEASATRATIAEHPEFVTFAEGMRAHFEAWATKIAPVLEGAGGVPSATAGAVTAYATVTKPKGGKAAVAEGSLPLPLGDDAKTGASSASASAASSALVPRPKELVATVSEDLLHHYEGKPLVDAYAVYQHFMDFWASTMQDDAYLLAAEGWKATVTPLYKAGRGGAQKEVGWTCELVPKELVIARFLSDAQARLDKQSTELDALSAKLAELEEEHGGEEGLLSELEKVNAANAKARLKEISKDKNAKEEAEVLRAYLDLSEHESAKKKLVKQMAAELDDAARLRTEKLTAAEVKTLVVHDKWLGTLRRAVEGELDRVSQELTRRVKELGERYEAPLPELSARVEALEAKVRGHLQAMGLSW
jgi:type I restriction enzyme M protein